MINVPIKDVISKICDASGLSEADVRSKIAAKVDQLYGLVSEEGAAHILANELGIKIFDISASNQQLKIKDILMGMKSVDITGKVVRKYELREFSTEKRKGKVANLLLADETGSIRVVFWNDKTDSFVQMQEDDIIKINGAYVRDNAGRKELHMGDSSKIQINPDGVKIETKERKEYSRKHINELTDTMSAEVLGTIVQVFDIKFFEVCPECNKRMREKEGVLTCEEHGAKSPTYNYVLNVFIDDGSSNIRTIFWKQQCQKLLKLADADMIQMKNDMTLFEHFKTDLLGTQIKVLGTAKNNMMGRLEFNAEVVFPELNPDHEVELLDHMKKITLEAREAKSPLDSNSNPHSTNAQTSTYASPKPTIAKNETKKDNTSDEFEISEDFLE